MKLFLGVLITLFITAAALSISMLVTAMLIKWGTLVTFIIIFILSGLALISYILDSKN